MTGGSLTVDFLEQIGMYDTGTFTQSGGIHTTDFLDLAVFSNLNGNYNLSGTGQLSAIFEDIGLRGTGTFVQTGGSHTVSSTMTIAVFGNSTGIYNQSGGTNSINNLEIAEFGGSTGIYTQSAGTNTITNNLYLGYFADANGTYNLSGTGQLSAKNEYIGYDPAAIGLFIQTGGTNTVSFLSINASGRYALSGGTLNNIGGLENRGTLDFDNGNGQLSANNAIINFTLGGSVLNATSSTLTIGANSLLIIPAGFDPATKFGTYSNSGITHTAGTTLTLSAGQGFAGIGSIDDYVDCQGAIAASTGGYINLNNGLAISGTGSVALGAGSLYVKDSVSGISGTGRLSAKAEYIQSGSPPAIFRQSGGSNTTTYLSIGTDSEYVLSGGTLIINGGLDNQGTLDLAGSNSIINASANSIVNLSRAGSEIKNTQSATLSIAGGNSLLIVPSGFDPAAAFAHYSNAGTIHTAGTPLIVPSGKAVSGWGNIDDHINCQGTLTAGAGGFINVNLGLTLSGAANLGTGDLRIDDDSSGISAGSLTVGNQFVGYSGSGTFKYSGGTNSVSTLYLGYNSNSSGTYIQSAGAISPSNEYVGYSGSGTFTHTAGTNTVGNNLYLGYNHGANGNYNLNGSVTLSSINEYIGYSGSGTFTHSAGTNTITNNLYLGYFPDANGTYNLNSPSTTLSLVNVYVGYSGKGTFNHTGGISASALYLGYNSGANGTFNLNNGSIGFSSEYIGYSGTGRMFQSAGNNSLVNNNSLYVGYNPSSNGSYDFTGGFIFTYNEYIGYAGTGSFNYTAGTNSIKNNLYLGYNAGSNGTFNLNCSNGIIPYYEYIGFSGTGTFNHSNGANQPQYFLYLGYNAGADGTYYLSGSGRLWPYNHEFVGYSGTGRVYQSGGSNILPSNISVYLGYNLNSKGSYDLSGGTLSAHNEYVGYSGKGTFTHSAGNNQMLNSLYLGYSSGAEGTYDLSGTGSLLTYNSQHEYIGYSGTGTFTHLVGTNSVSGNLYLGYNSNSTGTYTLSDGTLTASSEYIGYSGNGAFTQSAGINTASANLFIGQGYSTNKASGTYDLSGTGQFSDFREYVGYSGKGTFSQSGGYHTVTSILYLGYYSGSSGTYNLTGGTLIAQAINKGSGTASFNFGGGTLKGCSPWFVSSIPMTLTGIGGDANIDTAGYAGTLMGVVSGPGGLNKFGSGVLTLIANNTYDGNTQIHAGTLLVTGSLKSGGSVFIDEDAVLGGTGTVGYVTVNAGGHIAPGSSAGTLKIAGDLTLNDNAHLDFELGSILASDKISMTNSTLFLHNLDFSDFTFTALSGFGKGTYTLIDAGIISGSLGPNLTGPIDGFSGTLSISGNDLMLTVVPEPAAWILLATAGLAFLTGKRMRNAD